MNTNITILIVVYRVQLMKFFGKKKVCGGGFKAFIEVIAMFKMLFPILAAALSLILVLFHQAG
ncbi:UNVERIFIED_CONTAM: hypothetical protein FKN15_074611 [Acipenser sinensis]